MEIRKQLLVMSQSVAILGFDAWLITEAHSNQYLQEWIRERTGLPGFYTVAVLSVLVAVYALGSCLWIYRKPVEVVHAGATIRIPLGSTPTPAPAPIPQTMPAQSSPSVSSIRIPTSENGTTTLTPVTGTAEEHLGFPLAIAGDRVVSGPKGPGDLPEKLVAPRGPDSVTVKSPAPQLVEFLTVKRKFVIEEPPPKPKRKRFSLRP